MPIRYLSGITVDSTVLVVDAVNDRVGINEANPTQKLHISGNLRVTGAYYDSSNSAGSSAQVLSSTGSGTQWVNANVGTVTSVNLTAGTRIEVAGGPITTSGSITVTHGVADGADFVTAEEFRDRVIADGGIFEALGEVAIAIGSLSDAASPSSTDYSDGYVLQNIAIDEFGHVLGVGAADLDDRYVQNLTAGTGITVSGSPSSTAGLITVTNSDRGSSQNIFKNIAVAGQSTIVADTNDDTLTVVAGSGVTITTDATTDTLTISAAGTGGTVTSIGTTAPITGGTITTTGTIGITQSGVATDGYLSSTDWNTFNNKQNALTNPVTGTGTTNYVPKFTGASAIGNSLIFDDGTNVGIGTATPGAKLHVAGDGRFEGSLDLGHGSASEYSLEIGASRTGDGFAYVDLIGDTTYPDYGLRMIRSNGGANTSSTITHRGTGILLIETNEAAPIVFNTTAAERMRILPGGNVGINTTAPQQLLHVLGATDGYMMVQGANDAGNAGIYFKKEDTTGTMDRTKGLILFHTNVGSGFGRGHLGFCLNSADSNAIVSVSDEKFRMVDNGDFLADGDVVAYSTTISDARYKTNIQPIESALDKVNQMRGVSFDWTAVRSGREFGVIAQEIEKIAPEVVSEKELLNGETMKTVSYTSLVPFLIESIKELTQQVNELKAQLDGLTK
jgi:hypothetical protein